MMAGGLECGDEDVGGEVRGQVRAGRTPGHEAEDGVEVRLVEVEDGESGGVGPGRRSPARTSFGLFGPVGYQGNPFLLGGR